MGSRKDSSGAISPQVASNGRQNRASVPTPTSPYSPSWDGPARMPGFGFANGDPFAGIPGAINLRAGATSFQPGTNGKSTSARMSFLSFGTTQDTNPDTDGTPVICSSDAIVKHAVQLPVGTKSASSSSSPIHPREWFSTDVDYSKPQREGLSGHFLQIQGLKKGELKAGMLGFLKKQYGVEIRGESLLHNSEHAEDVDIVLFINDTRTAEEIHQNISNSGILTCGFVSYDWFNNGKTMADGPVEMQTMYVGQTTIVAEFKGRTADYDANNIDVYTKVRSLAEEFGEMIAFEQNRAAQYPLWQFRAEYYQVSDSRKLVQTAGDGLKLPDAPGWVVYAHQYVPPSHTALAPRRSFEVNAVQPVHAAPPPGAQITTSPTGRTAWWTDSKGVNHSVRPTNILGRVERSGSLTDITTGLQQMAMRAGPAPGAFYNGRSNGAYVDTVAYGNGNEVIAYQNKDVHKNAQNIVLERIRDGLDVRTTIMMRNIPRNWTRQMLKDKLDSQCAGRYNFMYLRIDFQENTNVGYAFVNFETATDIVAFVDNFVGKPWQDGPLHWPKIKLVECSYATIQGLDSLIDKFRNSSVMDENVEFRPLLLQTAEEKQKDDMEALRLQSLGRPVSPVKAVGEAKDFPAVNNRAKKERSTANAGQIGLFSPRNHRSPSERTYRSQYDRGTPAQLMEDFNRPRGPLASPLGSPISPMSDSWVLVPSPGFDMARSPAMYPPNMALGFAGGVPPPPFMLPSPPHGMPMPFWPPSPAHAPSMPFPDRRGSTGRQTPSSGSGN